MNDIIISYSLKTSVITLCSIIVLAISGCNKNSDSPISVTTPVTGDEYTEYNANRLFIRNGLQLHCWVSSELQYKVNVNDWDMAGFGGPTFFRSPLWNPELMAEHPFSQWSLAKAPYAVNIDRGPDENERENGFLSEDQMARIEDLTTICFGDEEPYSNELMAYLKGWFEVTHEHYPNVMVHNNQWGSQWSETDLRMYVLITKPDIISFDSYLFNSSRANSYRGAKDMAQFLKKYRDVALSGTDGLGEQPIGFGQYIQGFRNDAEYDMTESQLRLYYYMTWAFGGKWLNWFRYLQGNDDGNGGTIPNSWCMLLNSAVPGNPSEALYWASQCNLESRNLSDYLIRLQSTDVRLVPGDWGCNDGVPNNVPLWSEDADPYISAINGELLGIENHGKAGDIYVGYYKVIPEEEQGDPGFFEYQDAFYFMVVNAYTSQLTKSASEIQQKITVHLLANVGLENGIKRINRETGTVETIDLVPGDNNNDSFEIILPGGTGDLFYITP
jgi:hypothetical protein